MERILKTQDGEIKFKNVILDLDDTNQEEGIQITFEDGTYEEEFGYYDLEEYTDEDLEDWIVNNYGI